jgi:hypothetical protein
MQPLHIKYNKTQQLEVALRTMHMQEEQQCKVRTRGRQRLTMYHLASFMARWFPRYTTDATSRLQQDSVQCCMQQTH